MNAHKFVAEHGIDESKRVLNLAPQNSNYRYYSVDIGNSNSGWHVDYRANCIDLVELKQVVESLDTIDRLFGLDQAKHTMVIAKEIGYTSDYEQIKQAIADYKLVESYKSSNGQTINHSCVSDFKENETLDHLSIKQDSQVEVLDMVDVSPRCEVRNG